MNKLSKSDLIDAVAAEHGLRKNFVKTVLDATFDKIAETLKEGGSVTIQNFARFYTKPAQARSFRKINSDEVVTVGARELPKTKFSKGFVEEIKSN